MDEVAWEARGVALQVVSSSSGGSSAEAAMRVADLCARNSASWMLKVVFASFWVFWKTHRPQLEKRLSAKRRIHTLDVPRFLRGPTVAPGPVFVPRSNGKEDSSQIRFRSQVSNADVLAYAEGKAMDQEKSSACLPIFIRLLRPGQDAAQEFTCLVFPSAPPAAMQSTIDMNPVLVLIWQPDCMPCVLLKLFELLMPSAYVGTQCKGPDRISWHGVMQRGFEHEVATDPPNGGAGVGACGIFGSDIRNWHKLDCAPIWKQDFICFLFNVAAGRLRVVFGYLSEDEARNGECAPDQLGPVSDQVVQAPLSARWGTAANVAQGVSTLTADMATGATFLQGGMYRLCFSDDGSFASGRADLLNVLLNVQAYVTTRLPAGTGLFLIFANGEEKAGIDGESIKFSAAQPITKIALQLPLLSVIDSGSVRLKAISAAVTREEVLAGACAAGSMMELSTEMVGAPLSSASGVATLDSRGSRQINTSFANPIPFNSAGRAQLCYSDDGSFSNDHVDLVNVELIADGLISTCETAGCLAARSFRCHALLGKASEYGSCALPIEGVQGDLGLLSWSRGIDGLYGGDGAPLPLDTPMCGTTAADTAAFCAGKTCEEGNRSFQLDSASLVTMPPSEPLVFSQTARAAAVCYCTGLSGCDLVTGAAGFFQQVGFVQLFTASVMPVGEFSCATSSSGVLASIPFVSCVFCPFGGCPFEAASRIIFTRQPEPWKAQVFPAWHPEHRCKHAVHESFLLPVADLALQIDGGPRSDVKRFRPEEGYTLPNWPTFVPKGNWLDICFTPDYRGENASEWFKVGEVAVLEASLAASSTVPGGSTTSPPKQVGQVGQISMSRSLLPYRNPENVVGLTTGGGIRLASMIITEDSSTREACEKGRTVGVVGLTRANASAYSATVRGDRIVFDGGEVGKSIYFPDVATAVVCYCPDMGGLDEFGEQVCLGSPYWVPVGALVVAGPVANQYWVLPTMKTFRFEYLGVNLQDGDMLRLILEDSSCAAFPPAERMCLRPNEDPINGHALCNSNFLTANSGHLRTTTLASDRVRCDELNENCETVPLTNLETTDTGLQLTFAGTTYSGGGLGNLGLMDGDTIVLGAGVQCGENCSQPMLDMAKGFLVFQGLQNYLPLDEEDGDLAADIVGERHGTFQGSAGHSMCGGAGVQRTPGKWGFVFDGLPPDAATAFGLPAGSPVEGTEAWSVVFWVQLEKDGWYTLCGMANGNGIFEDGEVEIGVATAPWPAGSLYLRQAAGISGEDQAAKALLCRSVMLLTLEAMGDAVLPMAQWAHVAVVYAGRMSGSLRFYIDGALAYERLGVVVNTSTLPLQFAGHVSDEFPGGANASDGYLELDEIRFYNLPLSSEDVLALANASDGGIADRSQAPGAPIGIAIAETSNPAVFTVEQGSFASAPIPPRFHIEGGQWRRTNRGVTRGELMSSSARRLRLAVSRKFAGNVMAEQLMLVLQLNGAWDLADAAGLAKGEWSQSSPFVLTFRTGSADSAGRRYVQAEGHMSLTLTFINQAALRHMGSSAQGPFVSSFNIGSDEWEEATQTVCGIVFRELWSSDQAKGFPLPKGCFYRGLTVDMREIVIIFEKRNGLSPDSLSYQIVMNAQATNEMVTDQEAGRAAQSHNAAQSSLICRQSTSKPVDRRSSSLAAMADAESSQDQEFSELLGFLQDQKPEVRRFAAEGVLGQTEDTDFLDYCRRNPRKAARPLLRLAERTEAEVSEAAEAGEKAGSSQAQKATAIQAASSMEACVSALKALVNLSTIPSVQEELVSLNAPKRITEALRSGWLEGRATMAHWYAMLLANISTSAKGQQALCGDEGMLKFLVAAYVTKPRPAARDGYEDPLLWLGSLLVNVLVLPEGRKLFAMGENHALTTIFNELADRGRRQDMINAVKNTCLDSECHQTVITTDLIAQMARFLCPWESLDADAKSMLPGALKESLEKDGASLTGDVAVRSAAAVSLMGLCRSLAGRDYLRASGCEQVLRAWHAEETDGTIKAQLWQQREPYGCPVEQEQIDVVLPALVLSEDELKAEQDKLVAQQVETGPADDPCNQILCPQRITIPCSSTPILVSIGIYSPAQLHVGHIFTNEDTLYQLGAGNNDPQFAPEGGIVAPPRLAMLAMRSLEVIRLQDGSTRLRLQMMGGEYSTAKISSCSGRARAGKPAVFGRREVDLALRLSATFAGVVKWSAALGSSFMTGCALRSTGLVLACEVLLFQTGCVETTSNQKKLLVPALGQIYELDVYSLRLPSSGALPHRLMVQVMKEDGTKPHFRVATGRFYNAPPTRNFATIGRVLSAPQVMLQMAVPLRGQDRPAPNARPGSYFVIRAPPVWGLDTGLLSSIILLTTPFDVGQHLTQEECQCWDGSRMFALIQPLVPMVSSSASAPTVQLSVFFRAVEDVNAGGSIDVEVDVKQSFHCTCDVMDNFWRALVSAAHLKAALPPKRMRLDELVHDVFRSPWLFPKKSGLKLQEAKRHVDRVYGRPPGTWQILHVTFHPIQKPTKRLFVGLLLVFWLIAYPAAMKLRCSLLALSYSFMESCFTHFERGRSYTSAAQFGANLIYMPVLVDVYGYFLKDLSCWYILLFPLNIWMLEIVQGILICFTFGHNVAWCYADYADEFFWGFARVGHAIWWWGLGFLLWMFYPSLYVVTNQIAGPYNVARIFIEGPPLDLDMLKGVNIYGFSIIARNPTLDEVSQDWNITTRGPVKVLLFVPLTAAHLVLQMAATCEQVDSTEGVRQPEAKPLLTAVRSQQQEASAMLLDAQTKWREAKSAHPVRRSIQKIRVCTPENRDVLETEMFEILTSREVEMGGLLDQVRMECSRALEIADKRVAQVLKQREEEEERMRKPRETLQEMEEMLASFRQSCLEFEELGAEGTVSPDQVSTAENSFEEFSSKAKKFRDELKEFVQEHSKDFQNQTLPLEVRQGWLEKVRACATASKEADELLEKSRTALTEAKNLAKKELLNAAKIRLDAKLQEVPKAFAQAQQLVAVCEQKAEPFVGIPKHKGKDEHEMQSIAKELDEMVGSASNGVSSARTTLSSQSTDVEVEDEIKEDIAQYIQDQTKRLQIRLGQLGKRISRVRNLVSNYQKDLQNEKNSQIIRELKTKAFDLIEDSKLSEKAEEASAAVKDAEGQSEKLSKMETMAMSELQEELQSLEGKTQAARESLDIVTQMLCPVKDVDEDVRMTLCKHVLSKKSSLKTKLLFLEQRLKRMKSLVEKGRLVIKQKEVSRSSEIHLKALKVMDLFREDQSGKGLEGLPSQDIFAIMDADKDGVIGKDDFRNFFTEVMELADETKRKEFPSLEELSELFERSLLEGESGLPLSIFERLLIRYVQVVRPTTMTQHNEIMLGETVREVKMGEILEVLQGPVLCGPMKLPRLLVRATSDSALGWITMAGNAGSVFLKAEIIEQPGKDFRSMGDLEPRQTQNSTGFEWLSSLVQKQPGETYTFQNLPEVSSSSQGVKPQVLTSATLEICASELVRAMLRFLETTFLKNVRYGFEAPIYVPDVGPVTSLSAFYISLLVADPLGRDLFFLSNLELRRLTVRLPGASTSVMALRIATMVEMPSVLEITMPPGYSPLPGGQCGKRPWPGQLEFSDTSPIGLSTCSFERDVAAITYEQKEYDVFRIRITPMDSFPLMPGLVQFRIDIINSPGELSSFYIENEPASGDRICGPACWRFQTQMSTGELIDAPQTVASEPPPFEMALGGIMQIWPPGRNDRPNKNSRLIFHFSLGTAGPYRAGDMMPAGELELVGPPGTIIPTRCYHLVETRVVNLFGSVFNATQLGVNVWDPNSPVTGCEGNGETALISLSPGLVASYVYAFRIDIVNPGIQTASNFWTMTLLDHFAQPIPSFNLWAFPEISVSSLARNSRPSCYQGDCVGAGAGVAIPVQLTLRTQNVVSTSGQMIITAPLEFGFDPVANAPLIEGDKQTPCLIREYENHNMSALPYTWRMAERDCVIVDRGNPLDGTGTGDTRTVRIIVRYQFNPADLRPPKADCGLAKAFRPNATFVIYFWIHPPMTFRPAEAWMLETFSPTGEELDIGSAMGWEVRRVMTLFEHSNTGGIN
ncbi:CRWN1, partial [Symbiodinium microadriaticum]